MADTKITKRMILEAIRATAEAGSVDFGDVVTTDDVIGYVDATIAQLDSKAAKAREHAAKVKAEGDALRTEVEGVLTEEFQTLDEITAAINAIEGYEDVTKSKVTARMTQLVKAGAAHKDTVKTEDGRKLTAYAAGPAPEVEAE